MREHGFEAASREGEKSQYDVVADGETIFSKQQLGRFPEDGEIAGLLSDR